MISTSRRREIRRVITPDEIATRLGPRAKDIRVLMLGQGNDVLELSVPYIPLQKRGPSHVPADWYQRPASAIGPGPNRSLNGRQTPALSKTAADRIRELDED